MHAQAGHVHHPLRLVLPDADHPQGYVTHIHFAFDHAGIAVQQITDGSSPAPGELSCRPASHAAYVTKVAEDVAGPRTGFTECTSQRRRLWCANLLRDSPGFRAGRRAQRPGTRPISPDPGYRTAKSVGSVLLPSLAVSPLGWPCLPGPIKPKRWPATFRIWISSEPSVIR